MRTYLVLLTNILWSVTVGATDDFRSIAASNAAQWNQAFAAGKVDEIVSLYAQDAILVQPDGKISRHRDEIRKFWETLINQGAFHIDILDVKSEKDGSIVTITKLSDIKTLQDSHHPLRYHYDGVLYSVLKQQSDGTWKATVQHWAEKARS